MEGMDRDGSASRLAKIFRKLRHRRGASLRVAADLAGVNASVASRAERGRDAKLSTWDKLFGALGHELDWEAVETSEEAADLIAEEADRRLERRLYGA